VFLDHTASRLGERESIQDVARNLERWVHAIVARTFEQQAIEELAAHAAIPVINALSDRFHPCQALADFFTLEEKFTSLRGLKLAYIGDGNNVCHSLLLAGALLGATTVVACPEGYDPDPAVLAAARRRGGHVSITRDPAEAARGADVVYTDVWTSMGQEAERDRRQEAFSRYQVSERLVGFAKASAVVMHCLPAHRGEEITDGVLDGPQSIVLDQSENRLHAQKGIVLDLLGGTVDDG
jgi:ornithine carbamoyltransferase